MAAIMVLGSSKTATTATEVTSAISSTDTSNMYWDDYYIISTTDDVPKIKIPVEYKEFPKFKVVKKLNNMMKVKTFVENRQQNFNIRNAL